MFGLGLIFLIFSYISLKNLPKVAAVGGIFSFFLTGTCVLLLAVKIGESIYMLDYCESIIYITDKNDLP